MAIHIWVNTAFFDVPRKLFTFRFCLIPVNIGNSVGREFEVISQEGVMNAGIGVFIANTAKPDGAILCLGACELNGLIAGQTFGFEYGSAFNGTVTRVCF